MIKRLMISWGQRTRYFLLVSHNIIGIFALLTPGLSYKEPAQAVYTGSTSWVGKTSWEGSRQPTWVFLPVKNPRVEELSV